MLCNKKPLQCEARAAQQRAAPFATAGESLPDGNLHESAAQPEKERKISCGRVIATSKSPQFKGGKNDSNLDEVKRKVISI